MNRMTTLIAALTGAAGLAIGWLASGSRTEPIATRSHEVLKPPAAAADFGPTPPSAPSRVEFPLRPEDVANDRETPALAADAAGHVVLAWATQTGESELTICLTVSNDGGKTFEPRAPFRKVPVYRFVSKGKGKSTLYSTHVLPRLVAAVDGVSLGWTEAVNGGAEVAYFVAKSGNGGKTFSEPVRVHGNDASRPGFTTLTAAPDGSLLAAWLDGRNGSQQPYLASRPTSTKVFESERLVFAGPEMKGICPCCDLAAARLPDGSDLVAFRNNDNGHRDIWFARASRGGEFGPPAPLSADRWTFDGCPHDGPSLAIDRDTVAVTWMSAHSGCPDRGAQGPPGPENPPAVGVALRAAPIMTSIPGGPPSGKGPGDGDHHRREGLVRALRSDDVHSLESRRDARLVPQVVQDTSMWST